MPASKSTEALQHNEASEPPARAAYFLSLELRNVRCFSAEGGKLDLSNGRQGHAPWTILLGNNGTGKTTVLQALAAFEMISPAQNRTDSDLASLYFGKGRYPRGVTWMPVGYHQTFTNDLRGLPAQLIAEFSTRTEETLSENLGRRSPYTMTINSDRIGVSDRFGRGPICFGYGAMRRIGRTALRGGETSDATESLFRDDADLIDAEEWLLRLDYSASKSSEIQELQRKRRDQVEDLLLNILPDVKGIRFAEPTKAQPNPTVEFQTPYGWVPLRQLSHGYQTMIAWMVDLASRMVDRYPDSKDPLAEPAVVLVDEIDLHLHPTWQRKLIGYLTERFPNTQFIATAHSPLIVQAASDANIAVLRREGDHVVIDNDVDAIKNWRVDQILTSDLFELPTARPPQLDGDLKRRQELLTRPKLSKIAQKELAEIEARIGNLPTGDNAEQIDLMNRIDATLKRLEDRQGRKG